MNFDVELSEFYIIVHIARDQKDRYYGTIVYSVYNVIFFSLFVSVAAIRLV